jgi:uncharacterized membrane protein
MSKRTNTKVTNANIQLEQSISKADKIALWITDHVGTMGFFLIIITWTVCWLGWNTFAPKPYVFDPVPACVFWLFISNMVQICLMPLIMIGQNLQSQHSELRAESNFQLSQKLDNDMNDVHHHLEHQDGVLQEIMKSLNKTS